MIYSLDRVSKVFHAPHAALAAVDDLTFTVEAGERIAVLGRSGSGKSTLFRLLNATLRANQGRVEFCGSDVSMMNSRALREMRCRVGTVHQQHYLVKNLTVLDNTLSGRLGSWSLLETVRSMFSPSKADVEEALEALDLVGLADRANARPDELSGGQQQRLAIARMLMQESSVILADEPVASLDPATAEEILRLLDEIASRFRRTLIVAIHNVDLALHFFPRVLGLQCGKLFTDARASHVSSGELKELFLDTTQRSEKPAKVSELPCRIGCSR